jgi:phosphatidylserine/phosphatidylglycerophosphate/cardiolipin synthase-like enzyme
LLPWGVAAELSALAVAAEKEQPIEVYFSPGVSCTEAIVRELSNAKQTVHVQAYSFTSQPIARALTEAEKRGVKVIAILDASKRAKNYSATDLSDKCPKMQGDLFSIGDFTYEPHNRSLRGSNPQPLP